MHEAISFIQGGDEVLQLKIPSAGFRMEELGAGVSPFRVSGLGCTVHGFRFGVYGSGFGFRASGVGFQIVGFGRMVPGFGLEVWASGLAKGWILELAVGEFHEALFRLADLGLHVLPQPFLFLHLRSN